MRKPTNLQKWVKGSVRVYGTINGLNRESSIKHNLQASPELLNSQANNQEAIEGQIFWLKLPYILLIVSTLNTWNLTMKCNSCQVNIQQCN